MSLYNRLCELTFFISNDEGFQQVLHYAVEQELELKGLKFQNMSYIELREFILMYNNHKICRECFQFIHEDSLCVDYICTYCMNNPGR
jgi:hypothetical protein